MIGILIRVSRNPTCSSPSEPCRASFTIHGSAYGTTNGHGADGRRSTPEHMEPCGRTLPRLLLWRLNESCGSALFVSACPLAIQLRPLSQTFLLSFPSLSLLLGLASLLYLLFCITLLLPFIPAPRITTPRVGSSASGTSFAILSILLSSFHSSFTSHNLGLNRHGKIPAAGRQAQVRSS